MSFLAPLYILGALAISLPVLFHLIRRSPRGLRPFSSLMFLGPSPPRLTKRSRLEDILLLLLRASALGILAFAFARPFLREVFPLVPLEEAGRRVAVLVDTSASMRRGDLWERAGERAVEVVGELRDVDSVAVYAFDDELRRLVGFDESRSLSPERRRALVEERLRATRPGWGGTDLGGALVSLADAIDSHGAPHDGPSSDAGVDEAPRGVGEIVLVSDLQRGSRLDALASYVWPEGVRLSIRPPRASGSSNAGLTLLGTAPSTDPDSNGPGYRVRITNEIESAAERFSLRWKVGERLQPADEAQDVYVPAGESRVVRVAAPSGSPPDLKLVLEGDDEDFDNVVCVTTPPDSRVTAAYLGSDAPDDPDGLRYYAERALTAGSGPAGGSVRFVALESGDPSPLRDDKTLRLVILHGDVEEPTLEALVRFQKEGGTVLTVLERGATAQAVQRLLGVEGVRLAEAEPPDYAMLGELDYSHPVFSTFSDPRYGDFAKVRFWRYRRLSLDGGIPPEVRVLARFDDGEIALLERPRGRGRLLILTSGWNPEDSQLARSTKFVPLLASLAEDPGALDPTASFHVGDPLPLPPAPNGSPVRAMRKPDGTEVPLEAAAERFRETDLRGVYALLQDGATTRYAVNVSPVETRTAPLAAEELESRGVPLGTAPALGAERLQELRDVEVEGSQKLWRWLVLAVLLALIGETWLAGRRAARTAATTRTTEAATT